MKIMSRNAVICWLLTLLITVSSLAAPTRAPFPPTLKLGDQEWKLGYSHEDNNIKIGEYVTHGENVDNWSELITFQKFKFDLHHNFAPAAFAQIEIDQLKSRKYDAVTTILDSNPTEAIFEFRIKAPQAEQQDELQRIIKTADNKIAIIHYVIKKADMGEAERSKWIKALKNLHIENTALK